MPVTPSCPGIFPEELCRDERAIRALPTSVTAFVGRAERGPLEEPVAVSDFAGFARSFGTGGGTASLAPAVRAFFEHGGGRAIAVRIARGAKTARLEHGPIALSAASAGAWGSELRLRVRLAAAGAFHLQIRDGVTGRLETHCDLTLSDSPRRIDRVLAARSQLVRWAGGPPDACAALCEHARRVTPGKTVWSDDAASTGVSPSGRGSCGAELSIADFANDDEGGSHQGLFALDRVELVNLLAIPPYREDRDVEAAVWRAAASYCASRGAFLLVEPRRGLTRGKLRCWLDKLELATPDAAIFTPRDGSPADSLPSAAAAGLLARTDSQRGVWRAPAELAAVASGGGELVPVRRMALHLEESLRRGLAWVKSEPNDESLWAEIRTHAEAFLRELFRLGAFAGDSPRDAYFVRCDEKTTSARDAERGAVNLVVGFAPLRPREFAIVRVRQSCGAAPL